MPPTSSTLTGWAGTMDFSMNRQACVVASLVLDWLKQQPRVVAFGDDSKTPQHDKEGP